MKIKSGYTFFNLLTGIWLIIRTVQASSVPVKEICLQIYPVISASPVSPDSLIHASPELAIRVSTLKFYISSVRLFYRGKKVWDDSCAAHLMDFSRPQGMKIRFNIPSESTFDKISFGLGIDSVLNAGGAKGGDLDPVNGMYWTWQSGYINFKVEGTFYDARKKQTAFAYHIGGYVSPHNAYRELTLVPINHDTIKVDLRLEQFFLNPELAQEPRIMSPGKKAIIFSDSLIKAFIVKTP